MSPEPQTACSVVNSPRPLPSIEFDAELPVSAAREQIGAAIAAHQVVIVSGQTGSGKTTQLPKICLLLGRGQQAMIGHTQPRRLAATSVAKRIAQELKTPLGEWVGFQIRFHQRIATGTAIKLMTDGVLLAQIQQDRLLRQYDTLIIDEAHERSLNIDFLLGYIKQLLPKRPDLKVVITSATIDAARFAQHFADTDGKPAPVIDVSGRLYPVDIVYRPLRQKPTLAHEGDVAPDSTDDSDEDEPRELADAVLDAVDECARFGDGDILVFLPGEREIRETAEALRKHHPPSTQVLPLYARLSQIEQEEIFRPSTSARRVVLATNVAETSLTVPGIRFVVDSGLARVKRYSWRQKVEQLQIEPISQAAANQRAGRCGRLGPGVCIRLYDEADYKRRREFTEPEVLRSSLAGVILRMKSLRLDDVDQFPFVDPPTGRAVADGYQTLQELGAIEIGDDGARTSVNRLTPVGRMLAKLPLDPRVARMLIAAKDLQCLHEMLIIASALAVQDPRERPMQARELADQAHAKFADKKSEFLSWIKLWQWYHEQVVHKASQRKLAKLLQQNFLSVPRLREWHDIHSQLTALVGQQGWRINQTEATYEQIHCALLSGLLGQVGLKTEQAGHYQGVRGIRYWIHPGSRQFKRAGKWIVAAELVETTKLYARCVAQIEPVWIERVGASLLQRSWSDPRWDKRRGQVVAHERAALFGLPIYSGRQVNFGPIDPTLARLTFIREALATGNLDVPFEFVQHNQRLIRQIEQLEHQVRRPDILVDQALIEAFYDRLLPADIHQTAKFRHWFRHLPLEQQDQWKLTREDLMQHEAAGVTTDVFPKSMYCQGVKLKLDYHFEPGSPKDGVTLTVPLLVLNQITPQRWEWLVPGMLKEKVQWLVKSLPQKLRRHCVPLPDYAKAFFDRWFDKLDEPSGSLLSAIEQDMAEQFRVRVAPTDFRLDSLPAHLFMNFRVVDEHGRVLRVGRNLSQIKADLAHEAQQTFQSMAAEGSVVIADVGDEKIKGWSFGVLPDIMEIRRGNQTVIGYPALVDKGSHCQLDVFDEEHVAKRHHQAGLIRLVRISLKEQVRFIEKNFPQALRLGVLYMPFGPWEALRTQLIDVAILRGGLAQAWPQSAAQFTDLCASTRERLGLLVQEIARLALEILETFAEVQKRLTQFKSHVNACQDIRSQLDALMPSDFMIQTPYEQLRHFPRYLNGIIVRFDALRADPARDQARMSEMAPLLAQYDRTRAALLGASDPALDDFRWSLEELRVALFAQRLRTPYPVSVKRLHKLWQTLAR